MELIGDIVKLVSLPTGGDVPALLKSSVKVVAGGGFGFVRIGGENKTRETLLLWALGIAITVIVGIASQ